jgi:molecular chaperone Hsp33
MKEIFPVDIKILKSIRLDFFCRCSKESFMQKLIALGQDELKDMQEKGNNELVCRYCNKKYTLDDNDFESLFVELNSMNN